MRAPTGRTEGLKSNGTPADVVGAIDWSRIRAVVFDMDDTLLNWRDAEHGAIADIAREHLVPRGFGEARVREVYAGVMQENIRSYRATGRWWYVAERLGLLVERLGADAALAAPIVATFKRRVGERLELLPGAQQAIDAARASGRKLGLLTNGPGSVQRPKVEAFQLHRHFDIVAITGEIGHWKPDPQAFRHVLEGLQVEPHEAVMVGDSIDFDITPARKLGMGTVWVDPGAGQHPDADVVVKGPGGLLEHLA